MSHVPTMLKSDRLVSRLSIPAKYPSLDFKKDRDRQSQIIVVKYLKGKAQIRSFLLEKQPRDRRSSCVIDTNFITLEIYYNNELGALIDRNKDTGSQYIAIRFLGYRCTPNKQYGENGDFLNYW